MTLAAFHPPLDALQAILVIPAGAAVLLALLPGYWLSARLNVLAIMEPFGRYPAALPDSRRRPN